MADAAVSRGEKDRNAKASIVAHDLVSDYKAVARSMAERPHWSGKARMMTSIGLHFRREDRIETAHP